MMTEQVSPEDSLHTEAALLRRIVEQLRVNLYTLEEQAAHYSPLDVPLHLKNGIEETTKQLGHKEAQLRELQSGAGLRLGHDTDLRRFWEPFVSEGAKFYVPYDAPDDAPGTKMKVTALTMQAAFNLYRLLVGQFEDSHEISQIHLDLGSVIKRDLNLERLSASSHPHLIVVGAPGANPLSNYLMAQFKGIASHNSLVRQGYVFRISGDYLGSPFIVSDEGLKRYSNEEQATMQELGIYDLKPDRPPSFFPRTFAQYGVPSGNDQDCALIITGWASLSGESRIRRVVIIGGHSRHSTLFGTAFVVTNEEWARQVNALSYFNTETIIGLQPDPSGAPVAPSILAGPREIHKQPLQV